MTGLVIKDGDGFSDWNHCDEQVWYGGHFRVEQCEDEHGVWLRLHCGPNITIDINPDRISTKNGDALVEMFADRITTVVGGVTAEITTERATVEVGNSKTTVTGGLVEVVVGTTKTEVMANHITAEVEDTLVEIRPALVKATVIDYGGDTAVHRTMAEIGPLFANVEVREAPDGAIDGTPIVDYDESSIHIEPRKLIINRDLRWQEQNEIRLYGKLFLNDVDISGAGTHRHMVSGSPSGGPIPA